MTIRWGIIGCGDVCEVKSGPAFQKARGSALVSVMRRDRDKAADFARRHGVDKSTDDADAVIHDDDVDAVYVATPVGDHAEYARRVAAAGKPCYVEKPMARSGAECDAMITAFREAGQPLFVGYYRRGLPRFLRVKELVDAGRIGKPTSVSVRFATARHRLTPGDDPGWRLDAERGGGGLFMDLGSHALDVLDFIMGAIADVSGFATNRATPVDVEDTVSMTFRYESGVVGGGLWNFASGVDEDIIDITGTDARISLSCFGTEPVRLISSNKGAEHIDTFDLPNPPHVHQPLVQGIVDQLHGDGHAASTGESAARTAHVMDRVLDGYYGGRGDDFWKRSESWPGRRET